MAYPELPTQDGICGHRQFISNFSVLPSPASSCSSDSSTIITAPSLDSASSDTTIVELERLALVEENTQQDSQQEEKVPSSESTGATPNPTMYAVSDREFEDPD